MEKSENDIIAQCLLGNREDFGQLYDAYIRKIYDFIYWRTHHRETAEDLAAEVFRKAFESLAKYDADKGKFSSWLYRIARNAVIDHYRTAKVHANVEDAWDLPSDSSVLRDVSVRRQMEELKSYLAALTPQERQILLLRVWDGLTWHEIAEIVGKTEGSVKMAFSRTVARIRKEVPYALVLLIFFNITRGS